MSNNCNSINYRTTYFEQPTAQFRCQNMPVCGLGVILSPHSIEFVLDSSCKQTFELNNKNEVSGKNLLRAVKF